MTKRYLGNIIVENPTAPAGDLANSAAKGVWSLEEQLAYQKAGLWPVAGNFPPNVEDVFSTYLYTGTASAQTITNGIDLDGEGGLVWIRDRGVANHGLFDTERGVNKVLSSNQTIASTSTANSLTSFNADGFSIGSNTSYVNNNGADIASWTFRKAPKFFTCLTYSGTGPGSGANEQQVSHDLGAKPGIVIIKRTDATGDWWVFTDVIDGSNDYGYLNQAAAFDNSANNVATDSVFNVGGVLNTSGATYVAYLFASNNGDGGFGPDGNLDIIKCGSYTGTGAAGNFIDLGFEPQWLLVKCATRGGQTWELVDTMRGFTSGNVDERLRPASTAAGNSTFNVFEPTATGFKTGTSVLDETNESGQTYIYIAIRRGTKVPESATEVFEPFQGQSSGGFVAGFPVDMFIAGYQPGGESAYPLIAPRLTAGSFLTTSSTATESSGNAAGNWDNMTFVGNTGNESDKIAWLWKRAPGFFDAVAYTGDGVNDRQINHNLSVTPEMIWVKKRFEPGGGGSGASWTVFLGPLSSEGDVKYSTLNATSAALNDTTSNFSSLFYDKLPTGSVFTVGNSSTINRDTYSYIAYLFASLDGISKVGSVTHSGTTNVDCGFTSGARFVLLKRTDASGDWYVWDSERGIVSGNDPYLLLNSTAAEVTNTDYIDPLASGFTITSNFTAGDYIFYAIA